MRLLFAAALAGAVGLAARAEPPAAPPARVAGPVAGSELAEVLERAGRYVVEYERSFGNIVAEEEYVQRTETMRRVTRADLVFVRFEGPVPWATFRDVYEVDGSQVRERDGRLERLFLDDAVSAARKAEAFLQESLRHNIGVVRTINLPTLSLTFLHPQNQPRFEFRRRGKRTPGKPVEIAFREVARPTIVREYTPQATDGSLQGGSDLPTDGRLWVDASQGTVVRSEVHFRVSRGDTTAVITTTFRPEAALSMWVPDEMKERYEVDSGGGTGAFAFGVSGCTGCYTEAVARYTRVRRFRVTTDEKARVPER